MSEQSKCPFTGAGTPPKFPTGKGTSNRDWWPNSLNLKILRFKLFGHQSLFEVPLPVGNFGGVPAPVNGHFDCSLILMINLVLRF